MQLTHLLLALTPLVAAHGKRSAEAEMALHRDFFLHNRGNLDHCADKLKARGHPARGIERRAALASRLMKRSGVEARDLEDALGTSHASDEEYTIDTDPSILFADSKSCVLRAEATEGPFYVAGEHIRQNIVDDEPGVPVSIDLQVIDTETCEPVSGAFLEIWHCNSTGVYSGVVSAMNGAGTADPTNLGKTFHRGFQQTDDDGTVQFETLFPGHYQGRATHIHLMVHSLGAEARDNDTVFDLTASHVGQMYFDQDLISLVELEEPYTTNRQALTTNANDFILAGEAAVTDPFMQYVLLGDSVADGILAWLSIGVNSTAARTVSNAATLTEDGGETNPNGGFGGFGGGFGGAPGGGMTPPGAAP